MYWGSTPQQRGINCFVSCRWLQILDGPCGCGCYLQCSSHKPANSLMLSMRLVSAGHESAVQLFCLCTASVCRERRNRDGPCRCCDEEDLGVASHASIETLMCAVLALPKLRLLNLVESPVATRSLTALAGVLTATATTLTELRLDCFGEWRMWSGLEALRSGMQRQVAAALASLKALRVLVIKDWLAFVNASAAHSSTASLGASLPELQSIAVREYPCRRCNRNEHPQPHAAHAWPCQHFPPALPFVALT